MLGLIFIVLFIYVIFMRTFQMMEHGVNGELHPRNIDINLDELEFEAQVADTDAFIAKWMAQKTKNA